MIRKYQDGGQQLTETQQQGLQYLAQMYAQQTGKDPQQDQQGFMQFVQQLAEQAGVEDIGQLLDMVYQQAQGQAQAARRGAKLNYLRKLTGKCPEGTELMYFKAGGRVCSKCVSKKKVQKEACGKKIKKGQNGLKETIRRGANTVKNSYVGRPLVTGISNGWNSLWNGDIRGGINSIANGIIDSANRGAARYAPIITPPLVPSNQSLIDQERERRMNTQVNRERSRGKYYQQGGMVAIPYQLPAGPYRLPNVTVIGRRRQPYTITPPFNPIYNGGTLPGVEVVGGSGREYQPIQSTNLPGITITPAPIYNGGMLPEVEVRPSLVPVEVGHQFNRDYRNFDGVKKMQKGDEINDLDRMNRDWDTYPWWEKALLSPIYGANKGLEWINRHIELSASDRRKEDEAKKKAKQQPKPKPQKPSPYVSIRKQI